MVRYSEEIFQCAKQANYEQIELEVVASNQRAITLYEKYGFITYGNREQSFKFKDGTYASELLMMLKL